MANYDNTRRTKMPEQFTKFPHIEDHGALYFDSIVFWPERERIAVFIDGHNMFSTIKAMQRATENSNEMEAIGIDYKRMHNFLSRLGILTNVSYYIGVADDDRQQSVRPLIDWLAYNGYKVVPKPIRYFNSEDGRQYMRGGNTEVEIAVDVMQAVHSGKCDHVILVSGDGDFTHLVNACINSNVRVTVISSKVTEKASISEELRKAATQFMDLYEIFPLLRKEDSEKEDSAIGFRRPAGRDTKSYPVASEQT